MRLSRPTSDALSGAGVPAACHGSWMPAPSNMLVSTSISLPPRPLAAARYKERSKIRHTTLY